MSHVSLLKRHGLRQAGTDWAVSCIANLDDVTERGDLPVFLCQEHVIAQHPHKRFSASPDDPRRVFINLSHDMDPKSRENLAPPGKVIDSMKHWYEWVCMKCEKLFHIKEGELAVTAGFRNVIVVHLPGVYANFSAVRPTEIYLALGQIAEHRILSYPRSSSRLHFVSLFPHKRRQASALRNGHS